MTVPCSCRNNKQPIKLAILKKYGSYLGIGIATSAADKQLPQPCHSQSVKRACRNLQHRFSTIELLNHPRSEFVPSARLSVAKAELTTVATPPRVYFPALVTAKVNPFPAETCWQGIPWSDVTHVGFNIACPLSPTPQQQDVFPPNVYTWTKDTASISNELPLQKPNSSKT